MIAPLQSPRHLFSHGKSPEGESSGNPFGQGKKGDLQVHAARGEHGTRPAEAGLDLVDNQQGAVCLAQIGNGVQIAVGRDNHSSLALDRFKNDGRHLIIQRSGNFFDAVVRHKPVVRHEGVELVAVLGLPRRRGGADGPAVKALMRGDDIHPARDFTGQFDDGVIGLGPAVREEDPRQSLGQNARQKKEKPCPGRRVGRPGTRVLHDLPALCFQGIDDGRMGMSQAGHPPAGRKVNVLPAILVPYINALPPVDRHGQFFKERRCMGVFNGKCRLLRHHACSLRFLISSSRSTLRRIFPAADWGREVLNSISFGTL